MFTLKNQFLIIPGKKLKLFIVDVFFNTRKHHPIFICETFLFFHILYFFYTQLVFVFNHQEDFYIFHARITAFFAFA